MLIRLASSSNEYTKYTIFNTKKRNHPKLSKICSHGIFTKGHKNGFETAMVNETSVFEPLTVYCMKVTVSCYQEDFSNRILRARFFKTQEFHFVN